MAELGTTVGTAVVGKCTEVLVDPVLNLIWNRFTRVFKWESNVKNMKKKVEKLAVEKDRVREFIAAAGREGEEAALNVTNWLTSAEKYIGEMKKLGDDEDKAKKKCFAGLCPNPKARYKISKKVEEYLEAVAPLLEEAAGFKFPASYCPPPNEISTAAIEGFEQFDSRMPTLNRVMEALRSASVDKIGIHGLPGVGKTMLAKEVARQAKEAQLFDVIVMASVNKNPDLKKIQEEIADKLGLRLRRETEFGRAYQLKEYLKKKKKILVILDDIWAKLNLNDLGIPFEDKKNEPSSTGEELMQCKILLTSRHLDVLSDDMGTHENIQVGALQGQEAWTLMKKIVGDEVENPDLLDTAKAIVEKCAGLPLAVEVVAKALKGKEAHVWRDALLRLKRPSEENFKGIPEIVYSAIELSYDHLDHLEGEELRHTFLLCCLLGHNSSIGDLLTYGFGLGLFGNVKTTGEARDRVLTAVGKLKSSSLLLDVRSDGWFDMHDIVHDVAISIALRGHHLLSIAGDHLPKEWLDREALEDFKWIGLRFPNISELPDELECPQLTLFSLCSKDPNMKIPENFFRGTPKLRVLDFTDMCFSSLPSSICLLKNLQTLHVNGGVLEDMAIIGKLESLEVLSLAGSQIVEVPTEIGQLTQLKLLDLSHCTKLKMIRPHLLASLSKLEELYLGNSFDQWDVGEGGNQRNASLAELKDLHNLAALDVHVCNVQQIPKDFCFERLKRYKIFIGKVWNRWDSSSKSSKILKLELNTSISYGHSIDVLLKKTEELHLEGLKGFKNVVYELEAAGFEKLKYLHVKNASEVQHIVNSVGCAFPLLEELFLQNLNNLVKICHGQFRGTSFSKLRIIIVKSCNQLKNLFPFSLARQLQKLEEIRVTECSNMTEIVDEELEGVMEIAKASESFKLVQLRSLQLQNLPKFIRLCHGNEETNDSSSNSAPLFHVKIVFPNLEELQLSCINIKSIWGSQFSSCIQSLKMLIIEGCDHLEHLWSSSMAKGLVQLRCLEIKKCKEIREIIEPENAEDMEDLISFPMLEILKIEHLQKHTGFCSGKCSVEFPALKRLFIENCPKLKGFTFNHASTDMTSGLQPLFNEKASFPSLDFLCIKGLKFRSIWHHQLPANSFSKLKSLYIWSCDKLSTIVSSSILKRLCASLQELNVYRCCGVEEIFELGELKVDDGVTNTQLRILHFCQLPRLKHVCTRDPLSILTFRQLQSLKAYHCPNLQNLFQTSVAMELQQLERLEVKECGIKEVVAFEEGDKAVPTFVFSHLSTLYLSSLSRIRCFYPRQHGTKWPKLKKLRVVGCDRVNQFNRHSLHQSPVAPPLISIEEVILGLEKLSLTNADIIRARQFPADLFSNIKSLEVRCIHGDSAALPIFFFERFCKLQKLQIGCSDIKELFPPVASIDYLEKDVGNITKLKLNRLSKLKYIWKQGPASELLQNVKSLKVLACKSLISFSESTASFRNLTTLLVSECEGLRNLFSFATAQSLVQLQCITVRNCHSLTEIVGSEEVGLEDVIDFSKLEVLKLECLTRVTSFCSANFTFVFPLLEQITIVECPYFETFCPGDIKTLMLQRIEFDQEIEEGPLEVELNSTINQLYKKKVPYAGLQHLKLSEFPQLKEIWNKNPQQFLDFTQLCFIEICNCDNLRYLLTPSMALSLVVLETLGVQNCKMIEKILITEEGGMEVAENKMIFPLLGSIKLEACFNLTSFCSGSYGLEFPSLKVTIIRDCPKMVAFASTISTVQVKEAVDGGSKEGIGKQDIDIPAEPFFSDQVEFSSFLELRLYSMNMQQIFNKQVSAISSVIQSVGRLLLVGCGNLKYLFTSSMIKSLGQLNLLDIRDCKMMKEVVVTEGLAEEEMLFPNLEILVLEGLPKLTRFCYGNCSVFPSLTTLSILKCPLLETFISSPIIGDTSHQTTSQIIENAYKSPLFDAKIAFPCLDQLRIIGLENLRIIWHPQPSADILGEVNIESTIKSLGQLRFLEIRDCKMMKEVIVTEGLAGEEVMLFPNLETIMLDGLPELTRFCHGNCSVFPSLTGLDILKCPLLETFISCPAIGDVTTSKRTEKAYKSPLFDAKIAFPCLERLTIIGLENLRFIWHHQPPADSFCKLKSLVIGNCGKLLTIFSSDILGRLCKSLELLKVFACGSLQEIFELGEVNIEESHSVLDTLLRELTIDNLPRLKYVWTKDPRGILSFRSLQSVRATNCPNLQNMFSASMAMEFQQLEELTLISCGIEEVVAFGGEEAAPRFVFSRLSTLYLWNLPRLKCFYPGKHVTEWPMLKIFLAYHFEGIKETNVIYQKKRQNRVTNVERLGAFPVQLPLFPVEKVIPRLEKLSLTSDDIAMISTCQFSEDLFTNVKVLHVLCYHKESSVFPFFFIEKFFNLEELIIGCSHFKELFPSVASIDCQQKDARWHLRIIRKLKLDALPNLKYIWSQDSASDLLVQNVESLEVLRCHNLISLSESTTSFRNLTTLLVESCQGLRNLFSFATAQNMVQLQNITVENCHCLTEIVGGEGDGLEDVIVFSKLKVLKLKCSTRLTSFCSANFTFQFPLLEEVMVVQCPNFETFCRGVVRTPSLQRIKLTQEDNMGHPVVELNNTINQLYKDMVGYAGLQIEYLKLSDFPQLMEIWNKNPQEIMDFRQLHELEICNCGNLTYLLTPSMALSLVTLKMLKVENSAMMEHIITEEGAMEVDENEMTFPQLETISLDSCSNLTSFFAGNYKLVFPSLIVMNVLDCPKMVTFASTFSTVQVKEAAKGESAQRIRKEDIDPTKPFFSDQSSSNRLIDHDIAQFAQTDLSPIYVTPLYDAKVSFPHLSLLTIQGMGSLSMIWDNQLDADSFYRLHLLFVTSCEKLLNIFPITMLGRLQNLDVLEIVNCVSLEKIFQHQGPSASESQALKSSQSTMVETATNFVFPKVRDLTLARLPNLKSVYPQMHTIEWPSLETLVVLRCNQLRILASELLSYQGTSEETQLQSQNEHPLFWVNKASFPSLEKLLVERNDSMKEIWRGDDVKDAILFSKLETLKLKVLPRLESFCSGGCNFEFPSLKDVIMMECPNLLTFSEGEISTPKLQKVKLTEDEDGSKCKILVLQKVKLTEDEDERYREDGSKRTILVKKKGMERPQKLGICMQNKEDFVNKMNNLPRRLFSWFVGEDRKSDGDSEEDLSHALQKLYD